MPHRHRPRPDEALTARAQRQALDRPADGIRAVEHPHRLVPLGGLLQDVPQRRHEGVDAATDVLQVDQQVIEAVHHAVRRSPYLTVKAEDGDPMHRVDEVARLHHVVLLVAAQPVLGSEGGCQPNVTERRQGIQGMHEIARDGSRMGEQRHAPSGEGLAELRLLEQAIDTELHGGLAA